MSTLVRREEPFTASFPLEYIFDGPADGAVPHGDMTRDVRRAQTGIAPVVQPDVRLKRLQTLPAGKFELLQSWEGVVTSVRDQEFTAVISDCTNRENPQEEVIIGFEEISDDDRLLVNPGAVFYWKIGYKDAPGEPRRRVSQIRFRRILIWTQHELDEASYHASEFAKLFP